MFLKTLPHKNNLINSKNAQSNPIFTGKFHSPRALHFYQSTRTSSIKTKYTETEIHLVYLYNHTLKVVRHSVCIYAVVIIPALPLVSYRWENVIFLFRARRATIFLGINNTAYTNNSRVSSRSCGKRNKVCMSWKNNELYEKKLYIAIRFGIYNSQENNNEYVLKSM